MQTFKLDAQRYVWEAYMNRSDLSNFFFTHNLIMYSLKCLRSLTSLK